LAGEKKKGGMKVVLQRGGGGVSRSLVALEGKMDGKKNKRRSGGRKRLPIYAVGWGGNHTSKSI